MKRILYASLAVALVALSSLSFAGHASADSFNQNKIIDDAIFDNSHTMTASQIDSWLNTNFPGSCISKNNGFAAPDPTGYSASSGTFSYGGDVSAGQVIADAGLAYGLNPQVLLATLQKEEGLVAGNGPYGCSALAISASVGYGCPDGGASYNYSGFELYSINGTPVTSVSGTCVNSAAKAGFSRQIIHAAWLLKFGEQRSKGNIGWDVQLSNYPQSGDSWDNSDDPTSCYSGPMTQGTFQRCPSGGSAFYDGYTTIDGVSVHMDDGATAALYWYTPHFSGNQSFFNLFVGWFGSPYANCTYPPAVKDGIYRLYNHGTGNELLTSSPSEVCVATSIGWMYDGQILQDADSSGQGLPVYRLENNGRYLFTASATERDNAMSTYGYKLDGIAFYGDDPNIDTSNARAVYRLASPIGTYLYTISTYERDDMINYGYRYEGVSFYLKENPGATVTPAYRLSNPSGAFLFTISPAERDLASGSYGYTYQGTAFNAINVLNPITVPIYRLATNNGYLLTRNLIERANARDAGYRDEGVQMYTYGTMNDSGLHATYRLDRSGSFFYTTSSSEISTAQSYGYRLDGNAFLTP